MRTTMTKWLGQQLKADGRRLPLAQLPALDPLFARASRPDDFAADNSFQFGRRGSHSIYGYGAICAGPV